MRIVECQCGDLHSQIVAIPPIGAGEILVSQDPAEMSGLLVQFDVMSTR